MVSLKTRSFPVMNADLQLEGMISREDVMRALDESTREARQEAELVVFGTFIDNTRSPQTTTGFDRTSAAALHRQFVE
jgi:hypothetical protein